MAETKTDKEPSIEEILESIRQIISEDGDSTKPAEIVTLAAIPEPAPAAAPPPPPPAPAPAPQKVEAVLELTDRVEPLNSDLDLSVTEPPAMSPAAPSDTSAILSETTATAATEAMSKLLAGNVAVETEAAGRTGNVTLEDMARDLMRPLIKSWLDQNLPGIIEKMVQKEIEKISRRAGG